MQKKISKKSSDKLYSIISEDIMKARIAIRKSLQSYVTSSHLDEIDSIMSKLNKECPENAINVFKNKLE